MEPGYPEHPEQHLAPSQAQHSGHDKHAGHSVAMFRNGPGDLHPQRARTVNRSGNHLFSLGLVDRRLVRILKQTGWRLPDELRRRLVAYARRMGLTAEGIAAQWLEDRLLIEEKKEISGMGKPLNKD
jgi:hypothetical protein